MKQSITKLPSTSSEEEAQDIKKTDSKINKRAHARHLSQTKSPIFTKNDKYFFSALMELRINSNLDFLELVQQYRKLHSGEEIPLTVSGVQRTGKKVIFFDLDHTLIYCEVKSKRNYDHTFKLGCQYYGLIERPGLQLFLEQLKDCDLVVYSAACPQYAQKIVSLIDKEGKYFKVVFTRKHCTEQDGEFLKDLSVLNRNPQDVILVDNSPVSATDNYVPITTFRGKSSDTQLEFLGAYLQKLIKEDDVRLKIRQDFRIEFLH